jgi:hypothetical protein
MMIIGVDYHPSFQTIAFLIEETAECGEQELSRRTARPASIPRLPCVTSKSWSSGAHNER